MTTEHPLTSEHPESAERSGVVAEHISAINSFDLDRIMATFAADAYVNDNRREIAGADAIRRFMDEGIRRRSRHDGRARGHRPPWRRHRAGQVRRHLRQDQPARGARHVELLRHPWRPDRQPRHHLQPALAILRAPPGRGGRRRGARSAIMSGVPSTRPWRQGVTSKSTGAQSWT